MRICNDITINRAYEKFLEKHGYLPRYFNAYNCSEIKEVCPTLTSACGVQNSSGCVLVLESKELNND